MRLALMDWMRFFLTCFCVFLRLYHSHTHHCSWRSLSRHITPNKFESCSLQRKQHNKCKKSMVFTFSSEWFLAKHINFGVCLVQYLLEFPLKNSCFSKTRLWSIIMVTRTPKRRVVPLNKLRFLKSPQLRSQLLRISGPKNHSSTAHLFICWRSSGSPPLAEKALLICSVERCKLAKGICNS